MHRLKKIIARDILDRDCAVCYIDGEFIEGNAHHLCIKKYVKRHCENENDIDCIESCKSNIKQMAFAHLLYSYTDNEDSYYNVKGCIYIEQNSLVNIDMNTASQLFKKQYPEYDICIDETDEKLAKQRRKVKTANYISNDFDSFFLDSGDMIAIGNRLVNNKPWYQVYQEGLYNTSSYYDGPDYDRASQIYKDLLTAFKGVKNTEKYVGLEVKIKKDIESLINEKKNDDYNFQRLKSDPLFLGVNDFG